MSYSESGLLGFSNVKFHPERKNFETKTKNILFGYFLEKKKKNYIFHTTTIDIFKILVFFKKKAKQNIKASCGTKNALIKYF